MRSTFKYAPITYLIAATNSKTHEKKNTLSIFFESLRSWFDLRIARFNGNDRLNLNLYNVLLEPVSGMMQFNGSLRASFLRLQNRCGFFLQILFLIYELNAA